MEVNKILGAPVILFNKDGLLLVCAEFETQFELFGHTLCRLETRNRPAGTQAKCTRCFFDRCGTTASGSLNFFESI